MRFDCSLYPKPWWCCPNRQIWFSQLYRWIALQWLGNYYQKMLSGSVFLHPKALLYYHLMLTQAVLALFLPLKGFITTFSCNAIQFWTKSVALVVHVCQIVILNLVIFHDIHRYITYLPELDIWHITKLVKIVMVCLI